MTKIAVILILVGLTVMASAYNLRRPYFDQNVLTGEQDELGIQIYVLHIKYVTVLTQLSPFFPFLC